MKTKIKTRSKGQSAIASAAYISGGKLYDEKNSRTIDYGRKGGIVFSDIMLPENAPAEYQDRQTLWNAVHDIESKSNSQLAREIIVALPREFTEEERIKTLREYCRENFVQKGMVADMAIHDEGDGNPHAHILLTTRSFKQDGTWASKRKTAYKLDDKGEKIPVIDPATGQQKIGARGRKVWQRHNVPTNDWDTKERLNEWRENWAIVCNKRLEKYGQSISHKSYKERGIDKIAEMKEGYIARKIERQGGIDDRCEYNRTVRAYNRSSAALAGMDINRRRILTAFVRTGSVEQVALELLLIVVEKMIHEINDRPLPDGEKEIEKTVLKEIDEQKRKAEKINELLGLGQGRTGSRKTERNECKTKRAGKGIKGREQDFRERTGNIVQRNGNKYCKGEERERKEDTKNRRRGKDLEMGL